MLRNTVDLANSQRQMLETILQNRLGLKYMQSKKLVAKGREELGMEKTGAWTPELEAKCLELYVAEHGPIQERDYSSPEASKVSSPNKSFVPSTPSPAKPAAPLKPVETRDPEPPELTPEQAEEKDKEEEKAGS